MSDKCKITIFTPTYNRAYILENLYHSICRQTFRNFEWLIIDDGSTDNTQELVGSWIKERNDFPINYYKKENGGKCSAINVGLDLSNGEVFLVIDSDDILTEDAIEKITLWSAEIDPSDGFCAVAGNLGTSSKETPNNLVDGEYRDCTFLDRYGELNGEKAIAFFTGVHQKYKYPLYENERFMTEAVVWNRMARDGYKVRFFNDIICIYEYRNDGLTKAGSKLFINNPQGYGLWLREKAEFMGMSFKDKLKMWYTFYCDLSTCDDEHKVTKRQCAQYIGAPTAFMYAAAIIHGVKKSILD